jgi:protein-S-isoprenylcysteine O-methyltransferase Ste14
MKARLLVFFQFLLIFLVLFSGPLFPSAMIFVTIEIGGVAIGIWAIFEQGIGNFHIRPANKVGARLIDEGIYKWVRHPMYLAIIVTLSPLLADHFTYFRLFSFIALLFVLVLKLEYEEKQLLRHFSTYPEYQKHSWKLIPFVF